MSNFDTGQMEDLFRVTDGDRCTTNQVPYSLSNRRIERDLLTWCTQHNMPVMAYSPLGGDNNLVIGDPTLVKIGAAHGCSAAAVALAWVIRNGNVIAIPESGVSAHVKENAVALSLTLTPQDIQDIGCGVSGSLRCKLANAIWSVLKTTLSFAVLDRLAVTVRGNRRSDDSARSFWRAPAALTPTPLSNTKLRRVRPSRSYQEW